jgi:hypothetical protein
VTKLSIELVPKLAHFQNARAALTRAQWDHVKAATASAAAGVCEICGPCERVEAQTPTTGVQYLVRTLALCPWCHRAKHWGHTEGTGLLVPTRRHILRVNNWSDAELEVHIRQAWREWARLSKFQWFLDISVLDPVVAGVKTRRRAAAQLSG